MHHFFPLLELSALIYDPLITLPKIVEDRLKKPVVFSSGPLCLLHFSSQSAALVQSIPFLITFAVQCIYSGLPIKIKVFSMIPLSIISVDYFVTAALLFC